VKRKLISIIATAALAFALFPAVAHASAPGYARLASGVNLLPGNAQEMAIAVQATTTPVNHVQISFPTGMNGLAISSQPITPPSGWTAETRVLGQNQHLIFRGGSIGIGGTTTFSFLADAPRPLNSDQPGIFDVALSGNNGQSSQQATPAPGSNGTLTSTIRILETFDVSAIEPAGVRDGSGTGGQEIQIRTGIRNHALSSVVVTPTLVSRQGNSNGTEQITAPSDQAIGGNGGTGNFVFDVTLGPATSSTGDRSIAFNAGGRSEGATALGHSLPFQVQVAPTLHNVANLQPRTVAPDRIVTFNADVEKRGTPTLRLTGGSLEFAQTVADFQGPLDLATGTNTGTMTFQGLVRGEDGSHGTTFKLEGVDSNDAPFSQTLTPNLPITIDGLAPIISLDVRLPLDGDGRPQEKAKTGDTITITGHIDDRNASLDFVQLQPDRGTAIAVDVTRVIDPLGGDRFVGRIQAPFDLNATSFVAAAQGTDQAGNVGQGFSDERIEIDNFAPELVFGRTMEIDELKSIRTNDRVFAGIEVQFEDANDTLKGGCNPLSYRVDGEQVVNSVRYTDGSPCVPGERGPSDAPNSSRFLLLSVPIHPDAQPAVTYEPVPGDRAKDGAGNFTDLTRIDTVTGIAPPLPEIVTVFRNTTGHSADNPCDPSAGRCEQAYYDRDEDAFYTRFGGSDPVLQIGGARTGYRMEVLNEAGVVLNFADFDVSGAYVRAPILALDGEYVRKVRFINAAGIPGPTIDVTLVLDTVRPTITDVSSLGGVLGNSVTVTMSELVPGGSNYSEDWVVVERLANGNRFTYPPDSVSGSAGTRTLTVSPRGVGSYETVEYAFIPGSGKERYFDRAGNTLADTLRSS
jgi:hypothetical protein